MATVPVWMRETRAVPRQRATTTDDGQRGEWEESGLKPPAWAADDQLWPWG
ncbi:hypothetical protein [Pseudaquabacterium pictum]|uniref:hypothetical protein n=1 Tax=Pseudaquabacterium pictum TaxID=2315236 RepID=UPI0012B6A060|nr:hypothetical protein [Rubrivivax pictus]